MVVTYSINDINPYIIRCGTVNGSNCPSPGTQYEERRVRWYELELILWGEGFIVTDGKKIATTAGNLFFRKPGMVVQGNAPYHCCIIVFDIHKDTCRYPLYSDYDCFNGCHVESHDYEWFAKENFSDFDIPPVMTVQHIMKFEELFSQIFNCFIEYGANGQFFLKTYLMQLLMLSLMEWETVKILQNPSRSIQSN